MGLAAALAFLSSLGAADGAAPVSPWGQLAINDVEAAHASISVAHVGPVDPDNPDFSRLMEEALAEARGRAAGVDSWEGYRFTLQAYADRFEDGHLYVSFLIGGDWLQWPGFHVVRRGGRTVIHDTGGALDGAEILSCDGAGIDTVVAETSGRFYGAGAFEGALARATPYAFVDEGNPFVERPRTCAIYLNDAEQVLELDWSWTPVRVWRSALDGARGGADALGLVETGPGRFWLSLPTFNPSDDEVAQFEALIATLEAEAAGIRRAERLVIDVRGNGGGNSSWGRRIAHALWTEQAVDAAVGPVSRQVAWRVSQTALDRLSWLEQRYRNAGNIELAEYYAGLHAGVSAAAGAGESLWVERRADPESPPPADNPMQADVIVLMDEGCASACLNFLDMMDALDGVRLAGAPSYADAVYNESYSINLPSGAARFVHTLKVIRGGARGHNEAYEPDLAYTGADWSQDAIEAWIDGLE